MRIGYLGVGSMGQPMAEKLLDVGHELGLYDVREDAMRPLLPRQARRAGSPKELADASDTVVVSLPTLAAFCNAVTGEDGLLSGKALKTLVNTCTVGGRFLAEIESVCAAKGITVIDAPISGGPVGARAGTLAVMVSGDPAKVAELMAIFRLWGHCRRKGRRRPGHEAHQQHRLCSFADRHGGSPDNGDESRHCGRSHA
jgi:3-hydroxyisobutyrate dehydrogenase-like beta-hydroxyacid dehydrogenase